MGILETEAEEAKYKASYITFKWKTGEMTVDFRSYIKAYNYGINSVKRLLKLSDVENCAIMLQTVCILIVETKSEYKQIMDDAEKQFDEIDNKYLFAAERENAKIPIRKKRDARRKALNKRYEKITKLKNLLEWGG